MQEAFALFFMLAQEVGEEVAIVMVLANCLAVTSAFNTPDVIEGIFMLITTKSRPEVTQAWKRGWGKVSTFVEIWHWTSRLALAFLSGTWRTIFRRSRSRSI